MFWVKILLAKTLNCDKVGLLLLKIHVLHKYFPIAYQQLLSYFFQIHQLETRHILITCLALVQQIQKL